MKLGVNIDHIATLRQARGTKYPDPVHAAVIAELSGADQITCHLREDRRHINERDVRVLVETVVTRLNLELAMNSQVLDFALSVKPYRITVVPERREELTTEGGLNVLLEEEKIRLAMERFRRAGIETALFIDPTVKQVEAARRARADAVELHTGAFATAYDAGDADWRERVAELREAAAHARKMDFKVYAGHGLNIRNVGEIVALTDIEELNIGHSIVARASLVGMAQAVSEMKALIRRPHGRAETHPTQVD